VGGRRLGAEPFVIVGLARPRPARWRQEGPGGGDESYVSFGPCDTPREQGGDKGLPGVTVNPRGGIAVDYVIRS
jgi:hypothetical protein